MIWRGGLFVDAEDPGEIGEDPFRCSWCLKPFDTARMRDQLAPESEIVDAVSRMRAQGRALDEVLHYVKLAWERETH